jgi:hypothetical protein
MCCIQLKNLYLQLTVQSAVAPLLNCINTVANLLLLGLGERRSIGAKTVRWQK